MAEEKLREVYNQVTKVDGPFSDKSFISGLRGVLSDEVFKNLIDPRDRARGEYIQITVKMEVKEIPE